MSPDRWNVNAAVEYGELRTNNVSEGGNNVLNNTTSATQYSETTERYEGGTFLPDRILPAKTGRGIVHSCHRGFLSSGILVVIDRFHFLNKS